MKRIKKLIAAYITTGQDPHFQIQDALGRMRATLVSINTTASDLKIFDDVAADLLEMAAKAKVNA